MTSANYRRPSPPTESDNDWLRSAVAEEEDETQFTMDDLSVISRESQKSLEAFVSIIGKKENSPDEPSQAPKSKANIWENSFWTRPRNVDEEPPLSPGPMEFSSSPPSDGDPSSPSLDTPPALDVQQNQQHWPVLSKSAIPGHVFDLPRRLPSYSNLAQAGALAFAEHQQDAEPQDLSVFSIPPAPRDSSIAEPPFITHLRRHSTSSSVSASDVTAIANLDPAGSPPQCALPLVVGKPAVIRRGRFEIILGGEHKHPGTSLNPREMSHLHIIH